MRGGVLLGRLNFRPAFEISAVLDADSSGVYIAGDRAAVLDLDAIARAQIACDPAMNNHFIGSHFGIELAGGPYRKPMALE